MTDPADRPASVTVLRALTADVGIQRDEFGVAQVNAMDSADAAFTQGFVTAEDRLWQMDEIRRSLLGTASEVHGRRTLTADILMRTLGLHDMAEQDVASLDLTTRRLVQAYAAGVSEYIQRIAPAWPAEFRELGYEPTEWTARDSAACLRFAYLSLELSLHVKFFVSEVLVAVGARRFLELLPGYGPDPLDPDTPSREKAAAAWVAIEDALFDLADYPGSGAGGMGSNAVVFAPSRTSTGRPILANDLHLAFGAPAPLAEIAMFWPGTRLTGATPVGVPGILVGHNADIAWAVTNLPVDTQDVYVEASDATASVRTECVTVKGESQPVTIEVKRTVRGPVLTDVVRTLRLPIALRWNALAEPCVGLAVVRRINEATGWDEFRGALRDWNGAPTTFLYADAAGNIGSQVAGRLPVRGPSGAVPARGSDQAAHRQKFVPFDELPSLLNPPEGIIVAANSRMPELTGGSIGAWCTASRRDRLLEIAHSGGRVDVHEVGASQDDVVSPLARDIVKHLVSVPATTRASAEARDLLLGWDGAMRVESVAASVFQAAAFSLVTSLVEPRLGPALTRSYMGMQDQFLTFLSNVLEDPTSWWWDLRSDAGQSAPGRDGVVAAALDAAIQLLRRLSNSEAPDEWAYGRFHTLTIRHLLGDRHPSGSAAQVDMGPVGGDSQSPLANAFHYAEGFTVRSGPVFRQVVDVGRWDRSTSLLVPGSSGDPTDRHYRDQARLWALGGCRPQPWFTKDGKVCHADF